MTTGYNELVGLQAMFSKATPQYHLTHIYRRSDNGETQPACTMRGYSMRRHQPTINIVRSLCDAYAPAILSIWKQTTDQSTVCYLQFEVGASPFDLALPGKWAHWTER